MNERKFVVAPDDVDTVMTDWTIAKVMCDPRVTGIHRMSAVALFMEPGQGHSRHNHPESEQIIFVISGQGEHTTEDQQGNRVTEKISAGSLICIPKGAYHATFNTGWEPMRPFAVFSPPGPEAFMLEIGDTGGVGTKEFRIVPAGKVPARVYSPA
jgi:quercetin dioxygenase-like cupin family protein